MDILKFTNELQEIPKKTKEIESIKSQAEKMISKKESEISALQVDLVKEYNEATEEQKTAIEAFTLAIDVPFDSTAEFIESLRSEDVETDSDIS